MKSESGLLGSQTSSRSAYAERPTILSTYFKRYHFTFLSLFLTDFDHASLKIWNSKHSNMDDAWKSQLFD